MCGIFGYIGRDEKPVGVLLEGLKRLEYRGYDSAGVSAFGKSGKLLYKKKKGRVAVLESELQLGEPVERAIFHTRWATHGVPSDENAHPHADCREAIFVLHNGIIENYAELRDTLLAKGHTFKSETDTEVMPHLLEELRRADATAPFEELVARALGQIKGTYAFAILSKDDNCLIVARQSSPLILGIGDHAYFAASDPSALLPFTRDVVYVEDGEIAVLKPDSYQILTAHLKGITRKGETLEWNAEQASKQGHPHFMLKEIFEESEAVENALRGRLLSEEGNAKLGGLEGVEEKVRNIQRVVIAACGSAYYAGLVAEYMLEEYAGIPVEVEYASELRYRKPVFDERTALLVLSQSGETLDTLMALKEAKHKGVLTLGIVNVVGSTIAREVDAGIYNHAGPEIAVASTKAFVSQLSIAALLALFLGRQRAMSLVTGKRIAEALQTIPTKIQEALKHTVAIETVAKKYAGYNDFLFLGRKYNYPLALEGALKLKEVSYIHAEGYGAGEMKHGPIALVDEEFPSLVIAPSDSVYEKTISNIQEIKARGGKVIAIATEGNTKIEELVDDVIYIPKTLEMLTPLLTVIPLQLFAYYIAVARGCDVDKPRNLAKSVTVE